jgi:hypothetical protein
MWHKNLSEIADSQLGRAALEHIDDPEAAVQAVQDTILSPGFEKMASRSDRMLYDNAGRLVGDEVTREDAARDWAASVVDHVNSLVRDGEGRGHRRPSCPAGRRGRADRGGLGRDVR